MAEESSFPQGITVDLHSPTFEDGVLSTETGGVIKAPDLRIQARTLIYTRKMVDNEAACKLYAEKELILEFGEYYFIGEAIEYDFQTREGIMYRARTGIEPWFFGGETVLLHADGSFTLYDGYLTTSESEDFDWEITTDEAHLQDKQFLNARDVRFKIFSTTLLWLPGLKTNLDTIFDAPIRYYFKWGGRKGTRCSMIYEIFAWNRFKLFARLDLRLKRGLGGGFETYYGSEDCREIFNTINYVAHDNSLSNPHEKLRYRFQGLYHNQVWDDRITVDLSWDKLSDKDMATDYNDRGLELDIAQRTELLVRRQEENHIAQLVTSVRINSFQSLMQELPTIKVSWRPQNLGDTGIISSSLFKASYLDFSYANNIIDANDYHSSRIEFRQLFYRPIPLHTFTLTPDCGFLGIYYSNSPEHSGRFLALAQVSADMRTSFSRTYGDWKHVIEPYSRFLYLTAPTVSPNEHYIFDIEDGWHQSNTLRLGVQNHLFFRHSSGCLTRPLYIDLFAYGFFDTPTIGTFLPKSYLELTWLATPTVRHTLETAWDFQHGTLDHFNFRTDWTATSQLAIGAEYRHRSRWAWRKSDYTNFILDAFRSEKELLHSSLSDPRDTLLTRLFYQFNPNWAFLFEMRTGWNHRHESKKEEERKHKKHEPAYLEFETDLLVTLPSAWNMKISYQHRENDDRVALYFSLGLSRPNQSKCAAFLPCLEL